MESVLERGEKIDDLVAKSENLSSTVRFICEWICDVLLPSRLISCVQSKMFYKEAKKAGPCCTMF